MDLILSKKYPPSPSCSCDICLAYCRRPGWWTVEEAGRAIDAGYGPRMMLEVSPELNFGVLSPAFKGCEGKFAINLYAPMGCNFLRNKMCELHGTGFQPLECRFCHHDRLGSGPQCHADLEKDWNTPAGQQVIVRWSNLVGIARRQHF
jgi:hypothetical protein